MSEQKVDIGPTMSGPLCGPDCIFLDDQHHACKCFMDYLDYAMDSDTPNDDEDENAGADDEAPRYKRCEECRTRFSAERPGERLMTFAEILPGLLQGKSFVHIDEPDNRYYLNSDSTSMLSSTKRWPSYVTLTRRSLSEPVWFEWRDGE